MKWVVDASVVFGWFIPQKQEQDFSALLTRDFELLAPDLIFPEVCNGVWRLVQAKRLSAKNGQDILYQLPSTLDQITPSSVLMQSAFRISLELEHPAYDCFYLALAEQEKTKMLTLDKRLLNRARSTSFADLCLHPDQVLT